MKRIWIVAAAVLLIGTAACSKKVDTLSQMDEGGSMSGATKDSSMMTEQIDETPVAVPLDMDDTSMSTRSSSDDAMQVVARLKDIHFEFDRAIVRDVDKPILMDNAKLLKSNPRVLISIEGHCDERGTTAYNLALGERRAQATRRYLVALGVSPSQVSTVSYGEEKPQCMAHNEACWQQNRRAHLSAGH
ncbi:MAG: peptidoglycan-associated lipoprotein Pal [Leptospirillia bacterium]